MTRTRSAAAHPAGEIAAASDEVVAWLGPWVADQAEGATVNEILGLLVETALDPSLLTWDFLAGRRVVHPEDFIHYNQGSFELREDGDTWILRHRKDGRIPLRLRREEPEGWALVEPVLDDDALRAAARGDEPDLLSRMVGALAIGVGLGERRPTTPQLMGIAIERVAAGAAGDDLTCERVEWSSQEYFDAGLGAGVVGLIETTIGLAVDQPLREADPECWRVWLAQRGRDAVATVALVKQGSHCALQWVVCAPGDSAAACTLLVEALRDAAAFEDALTLSAQVNDLALADLLSAIGVRSLGPIDEAAPSTR